MARETLSVVVADVLRQALYDGVYTCGERLIELSIANEMNVSQNTARDALRILEQECWVVKKARQGVYVRMFDADAAAEIYILRATLEKLVLRWWIDGDTDTHALTDCLDTAQQHIALHNRHGALEALYRIHITLAQVAAKPQTAAILQGIHNQCRLLHNLREARRVDSPIRFEGYETLLTTMNRRDYASATTTLDSILLQERRDILTAIDLR